MNNYEYSRLVIEQAKTDILFDNYLIATFGFDDYCDVKIAIKNICKKEHNNE
jgi:hypothetical protein